MARERLDGVAADVVPVCRPPDLALTLRWRWKGYGLRGELVAENIGGRVCRLGGSPVVMPLAWTGAPLAVEVVTTLEPRDPPCVAVSPGQRAGSVVSWSAWCGAAASGSVVVRWAGGQTTIIAEGPRQPECRYQRGTITSTWFEPTPRQ